MVSSLNLHIEHIVILVKTRWLLSPDRHDYDYELYSSD